MDMSALSVEDKYLIHILLESAARGDLNCTSPISGGLSLVLGERRSGPTSAAIEIMEREGLISRTWDRGPTPDLWVMCLTISGWDLLKELQETLLGKISLEVLNA